MHYSFEVCMNLFVKTFWKLFNLNLRFCNFNLKSYWGKLFLVTVRKWKIRSKGQHRTFRPRCVSIQHSLTMTLNPSALNLQFKIYPIKEPLTATNWNMLLAWLLFTAGDILMGNIYKCKTDCPYCCPRTPPFLVLFDPAFQTFH